MLFTLHIKNMKKFCVTYWINFLLYFVMLTMASCQAETCCIEPSTIQKYLYLTVVTHLRNDLKLTFWAEQDVFLEEKSEL
jgi:hypothetical protein